MFSICSSLEEIDISNFNANYMISTEKMFCVNLLIFHLSRNFKPKKIGLEEKVRIIKKYLNNINYFLETL